MIPFRQIEIELGVKTLFTRPVQAALEHWYQVAVEGKPANGDPDTKTLGLPAATCNELARLTTLELEAKVEGSPRADWINKKLQRVLSPKQRRSLGVALALGSGAWKPYQTETGIGVSFVAADSIYPISTNEEGELTEAVFVNRIHEDERYYNRLEWMHVLNSVEDYHEEERNLIEEMDVAVASEYPCVQVINLAYLANSVGDIGSKTNLDARPEWAGIEPIAYLAGQTKLPVGYFVTPIVNTIDPASEMGAAIFAPALPEAIDCDVQFSRLDWEYEGGELGVDIDQEYLVPSGADGRALTDEEALRRFGVPAAAVTQRAPEHAQRLFRGLNVNTGIADGGTFYQVFAPSLRDSNYMSGLNQYLRNYEAKVGLSYGVFSQVAETEKTATEILSSKQKLYSLVSDLQSALEEAMRGLIDALNFWADQAEGVPAASAELEISFKWDDSILVDRQTEMAQWQAEVQMGMRSKAEYRQHFYGEDEATAINAIKAIQEEAVAQDVLQGVLMNGSKDKEE